MRFTTLRMMAVVAATAVGLAVAPEEAWYLGLPTPAVLLVVLWRPRALLAPGVAALAFGCLGELVLHFPMPAWFYLPVALALAAGVFPFRTYRERPARLAWPALVLAAVATLYLVPWSSRKPFLQRLDSVRPGMTVAEARRQMAGYMEGTGWRNPQGEELTLQSALVFRHSDAPAFNSDWGIVHVRDGRVTAVEFSAD